MRDQNFLYHLGRKALEWNGEKSSACIFSNSHVIFIGGAFIRLFCVYISNLRLCSPWLGLPYSITFLLLYCTVLSSCCPCGTLCMNPITSSQWWFLHMTKQSLPSFSVLLPINATLLIINVFMSYILFFYVVRLILVKKLYLSYNYWPFFLHC